VKSQAWLAVSFVLWVMVILTGMVWSGTYDMELFLSLWLLWMIVAVFLLSPQFVKPRHLTLLTRGVMVGVLVFVLIVAMHALRLIS
jgi:uncharacterized membrane protein